jgi:hypothetical protein
MLCTRCRSAWFCSVKCQRVCLFASLLPAATLRTEHAVLSSLIIAPLGVLAVPQGALRSE